MLHHELKGGRMTLNVGTADAWVRGVLAVACLVVAGLFNGTLVVSLIAVLFAILCGGTALTHSCPFYRLLGLSTRPRHSSP
jgi:hypothetical protein